MEQQQGQQNPQAIKAQVDMAKIQQEGQKNQQVFAIDMMKLKADQQKVLADIQMNKESAFVGLVKAQTERFAKQVDLKLKHHDQTHRHMKEALELHHKVTHANKGSMQ